MNITIIGCGWLGTLVGEYLSNEGHEVYGTYRSESGFSRISRSKIHGFEYDLLIESQISTEIVDKTNLLIVSLPPLRKEETTFYGDKLVEIVRQFSDAVPVIFTSSIGVYPKQNGVFDERFEIDDSIGKSNLIYAENALKKAFENRLTILRLGGLIGPKRHPVKSLQGRTISNDGSTPINLIHSADISRAISLIIEKSTYGKCYNLVFPQIISKKKYYNQIAERLNLNSIQFGELESVNRRVDGGLICEELSFEYQNNPENYSDSIR